MKQKKQNTEDLKYDYDDRFKEDLIHQLYHLVEELKKLNGNIEAFIIRKEEYYE